MYNVEQKQHAGKTLEAFYKTLEVCALRPEREKEREREAVFNGNLLRLNSHNTSFSFGDRLCLLAGLGAAERGNVTFDTYQQVLKPAGLIRSQARKERDT